MINPNDKNVLNIIAEETSYRLGDMGTQMIFARNLWDWLRDAWNLYGHMQYP